MFVLNKFQKSLRSSQSLHNCVQGICAQKWLSPSSTSNKINGRQCKQASIAKICIEPTRNSEDINFIQRRNVPSRTHN